MTKDRYRKAFLLFLVIGISTAFVLMLRPFLVTILMSAVFSGLAYPLYAQLKRGFGGHAIIASAFTLVLLLVLVVAPLVGMVGIVVNQAIRVTDSVRPVVERFVNEPTYLGQQLERIPYIEKFQPYRAQILTSAGDAVGAAGNFVVGWLGDTTRGTLNFLLHFFLMLYTMFFLLIDGPRMLGGILRHLPLREQEKEQMKDRFLSVTRATIKGTIVIGIIQGSMSGLAFWVAGIPDALFWTVVMIVLAIIPVIGAALVWVPACIILMATGEVLTAVVLAAFCSLIVGSVDNVLRPRLIGRDTRMHDILILFSTLGGLLTFGPVGFIVGPVLAGLFVTSWEIFGSAYRDVTPVVRERA